jgi:hypothetical protein
MGLYRKRPVTVEALQYPQEGFIDQEMSVFLEGCEGWHTSNGHPTGIVIPTLEGDHLASPGDWIIKGVAGEFYPCKPEIFAATYEAV